ncbi:MAG: YdhR family protein [Oscillatoriales cyanobacterium C42_A2020_001]|nr:YdhR family protein [Leptolyngbyaceae cyanobacterium C42_A2020_001]
MITAIVQFKLPSAMTSEAVEVSFTSVAPMFREIPGLVRKYFLLSEDGTMGGGVYLWESRQAADRCYTVNFRDAIAERFGSEPSITYFDSPVIVDNLKGDITLAA